MMRSIAHFKAVALLVTCSVQAFAQSSQPAQTTQPASPLSLGEAVRLAQRQSSAALGSESRLDEMNAKTGSARAGLLPQIGASWSDGQRTFNTASFGLPFPGFDPNGSIIGPVRTIDIRAHASAGLFDPAARSEVRNAEAAALRTAADGAASVEGAMVAAASAYVRLAHADALIRARASDSALARELLGIAQEELRAGVGVALDVSRAQTQVANVRAQLIAARNQRDRARLELARAAGLPLTTPIVLRDSLGASRGPETMPTADDAIAEALRSRADVRAVREAVDASARAVKAVRSERLPAVGVFGDEGATSAKYGYLRNTYSYGVQVSVPIFRGFRDRAREQERQAVLRTAQQRQHDIETQIGVEVRTALLDLTSSDEQVAAAREGMGFAEQSVAQARDRFTTGVAGSGDVVSAQLDLTTARRQYVDALASQQAARVALALAEGRLDSLDQ